MTPRLDEPAVDPALVPTTVTLVAALARNRVIGADGDIPWRIPADFAHFKATTLGGVLLMGRATYDSIGRPLPGRTTIVLTRDLAWRGPDGVLTAGSLATAFAQATALIAERDRSLFVVGGAAVYEATMPYATHQILTEIDLEPPGDTFYPVFSAEEWREVRRQPGEVGDPENPNAIGFEFVWWERIGSAGVRNPAQDGDH